MGIWDEGQRGHVRIRASPWTLARVIVRVLYPNPVLPAVAIKHPWEKYPWSGVIGDGQKIMDELVANLPATNERNVAQLNEMNWAEDPASKDYALTINSKIDDECITSYNFGNKKGFEIDRGFEIDNALFCFLKDNSTHDRKGWFMAGQSSKDGKYDRCFIEITGYELGGTELYFTIKTIQCCIKADQIWCLSCNGSLGALSTHNWRGRNLSGHRDFEIDIVADIHPAFGYCRDEYGYTSVQAVSNFYKEDELKALHFSLGFSGGYHYTGKKFAVFLSDEEICVKNIETGIESCANLFGDPRDGDLGSIMCSDPYNEQCNPKIYAVMNVWDLWCRFAFHRNRLCHAVHIIQHWARSCLYNPIYKKGRAHAMRLFEEI